MRLLYVLQQSIYTSEGKWLVADSNINMMVGLFEEISKHEEFAAQLIVDVLIGQRSDFAVPDDFDNLVRNTPVNFIEVPMIVDAFYGRQQFDPTFWVNLLTANQYDVIINCLTEISRNIKTVLFREGLAAKLITQCFWLDTPRIGEPKIDESVSYQWRQFDGMECSDLAVFTCDSTRAAFFENAAEFVSLEDVKKVFQKSVIWDFGYNQSEVDKYKKARLFPKRIATIGFLNRLSGINYTHHEEFIEAIELLAADEDYFDRFEVMFTNPSQKVSDVWLRSNVSNYRKFLDGPLNRENYFHFLNTIDISVNLFTIERYGGCALREAIAAGVVPVVAGLYEARSLVNYEPLEVPVSSDLQVKPFDIANTMRYAIDFVTGHLTKAEASDLRLALSSTVTFNHALCSFESTARIVIDNIFELLEV